MANSNVEIGAKPLGAVQKNEEDNVDEFLGFLVFSTTGEAEVPREWLLDQWEERELPERILSKKPSRWSAYRRAMRNLIGAENREFEMYNDVHGHTHECKYRLEKSEELGSNTFLLYVDTFWPEELIGEQGGSWREKKIGRFDFHSPDDGPGGLLPTAEVDKDDKFYECWEGMSKHGRTLFKRYQDTHIDSDLQKILRGMRAEISNAVPIRRSVYFFGNRHQDLIENVSEVWNLMNQYKEGGENMRVEYTPVVNLESQRELIASRAREMVEGMVDEIIDETLEEWEEQDEQTADKAAREIVNALSESEGVASEYNQLLSARLSIKDILKERQEELAEEQEDIIQRVLDQTNLEEHA